MIKKIPAMVICFLLMSALGEMSGLKDGKAYAQGDKTFPNKPINYWIPYAAGTGTDTVSRYLADGTQKKLGQPFMVINKPGASGATAVKEFIKVKPDGYTLIAHTSAIVTHKLMGNLDVDHHNFELIIANSLDPCSIIVTPNFPGKSIQSFVDVAKKRRLKVATTARGGIWNIAALAFEKEFNVKFDIIAVGGGSAEGVVMVAGGHVDAIFCSPGDAYAQIKAGNVRLLAVMNEERIPAFPEVPSLKEQGTNLKISTTRCILAPKATSKEILGILRSAFMDGAKNPKYIEYLEKMASMPLALDTEAAMKHFDEQERFFAKILKEDGLGK